MRSHAKEQFDNRKKGFKVENINHSVSVQLANLLNP